MNFCTITPTRGDRPEFLQFCKQQLKRMRTRPGRSYIIDNPPKTTGYDLVSRIKRGVRQAARDGFEFAFIVEDDDYYPAAYFDMLDPNASFFGEWSSTYYNLRTRTYETWQHERHSSLCATGFRISALNDFTWPDDEDGPFLDVPLWKFITTVTRQRSHMRQIRNTGMIGIKHGIGVCGGKGHVQRLRKEDLVNMQWLASKTDPQAFKFYSEITKCL